jgi:hypothetical protein
VKVLESKMEIGELWLLELSAKLVQTSMDFQFDRRVSLDYRNMYLCTQARYLVAKVGKSTVVGLHNTIEV